MDKILDFGATPRMPSLSPGPCPWPAISEAIQVPCAPQFWLLGDVCTPVKSGPVVTEPVRSDTEGSTPLSITATVTPLPCVTCQADETSSADSTHCCRCLA